MVPRVSFAFGVVSVVSFFSLGLAGGWWPALSLTTAAAAVALGYPSRRQLVKADQALLGMILGVSVIVWYVVDMTVASVT